jgi:hypothetical protein
MICILVEPIARAAIITPASTSERLVSTIRATKGAAAIDRGIITACGPILVPTMNRDRGISRIIRIMNGRERKRFTIRESAL